MAGRVGSIKCVLAAYTRRRKPSLARIGNHESDCW